MQSSVEPSEGIRRSQQTNTEDNSRICPAALIRDEVGEDKRRRASGRRAYQDYDEYWQEYFVAHHPEDLERRQQPSGVDVQNEWYDHCCPHQ